MNKKLPRRKCKECGLECNRPEKFYCNNKCQVKYKNREKIYNWLKGKDKGYTGNGMIRPFIRKYLIGVSNNRCNKCGWNKKNPITFADISNCIDAFIKQVLPKLTSPALFIR
jgi:glutathione peroxidase-family protein